MELQTVSPGRQPVAPTRAAPRQGLERSAGLLLAAIVAVPALLLTATAVARYLNGRAGIDLAIFDQGLWALSRGRTPWSSIIQETLLEDHFSPGLLLFAALYRLWASPIWLLVGQGVAAWASAWLVARRLAAVLGHRRAGLVGGALLLAPPVAYAVLFDAHSIVLGTPFALASIFALGDGRPRRALVLALAATLFRVELAAAVLVAFAALPGNRRNRLREAVLLLLAMLASFYIEKHLGEDRYWAMHYGQLGASPVDALLHPWRTMGTLLSGPALTKAFPWVVASGLLCLRRPRLALPALVVALPVLLSTWGGTSVIWFQYGFAPTMLLAVAWVPVVRNRPERVAWVVMGTLCLAVLLGPLPSPVTPAGAEGYSIAGHWEPARESLCLVSGIPADAGVSADLNHLTLLAHRDHAYLWPYPFEAARKTVLPTPELQDSNPEAAARVDYIITLRSQRDLAGPAFVDDGGGTDSVRLRRVGTTRRNPVSCG